MPIDKDLPDWIDSAAWAGFLEMRKLKKAPMTDRAKRMLLRKLADFRERGHDPNAVLDQSTLRSWTDVYEINERSQVPRVPQYRDKEGNLYEITVEGTRRYIQ